mgnify:FL=1
MTRPATIPRRLALETAAGRLRAALPGATVHARHDTGQVVVTLTVEAATDLAATMGPPDDFGRAGPSSFDCPPRRRRHRTASTGVLARRSA